ncbi:lytic transglycosylase domain-containing protein [Qipengyuania sp. DY56-A-20]|uniref:Lytic transglycosylase domain-containing protein n=1 Tax=Qipengyuania benthica TaxID=3067651 RepID=A0ABT9H9K1_9SPHN|nr:lytic transglycosylase domain-containing protein [Qipengyuania sp. DY56-A-20]MDP4539530.1 lytic transglycosylase domain-containing protein [Qipengyuania sp. DY56-A-20]
MPKTLFLAASAMAAGLAVSVAGPAQANEASIAYFSQGKSAALPALLSNQDRLFYASLFEAIDARNWDRAEIMLGERGDGPLHGAALAEYFLHPESPRIPLERLSAWLSRYSDLPQADQIARLAATRGLVEMPVLPRGRELRSQPGLTRRTLPRSVDDGTMPASVGSAILERIRNDDPDGARLLLDGIDASLSPQARAEWRQRVAWSYYIENRDAEALAQARTVAEGSGPWVAEGDWVVGLAAWRLGDCATAGYGFRGAATGSTDPELTSAAHYWASRALIRCREPEQAAEQLRGAARFTETLYGMLAREQLGQALPADHTRPDLTAAEWQRLSDDQAPRLAVMLAEIGRRDQASEALTHQARIGEPDEFPALARLARALGLPAAQSFMAYNAPAGTAPPPSLRWPVTYQTPRGGWQVDPALAFAHALQESNFRERVVSPANAIGLMQIRPIAAREYASSINLNADTADLKEPATNLAFGQRALEALSQSGATRGHLPKVMAAYNAGLTPVTRWNDEVRDQGDPLTWMESIPYWETRSYVAIVMRNYWMYLRQADAEAPSRTALAQNQWPTFPQER